MDRAILKDLIDKGLSTYKIAARLNMSQTNVRHHLEKFGLKTNIPKRTGISREEYNRRCYVWQKQAREKRKKELVVLMGGKCCKCGYDKNWAALEFHHKDPNKKEISIDSRNLSANWKRCLEEVKKCILVCANCHREIHHPEKTF